MIGALKTPLVCSTYQNSSSLGVITKVEIVRTVGGVAVAKVTAAKTSRADALNLVDNNVSLYAGLLYDTPGAGVVATYTYRYTVVRGAGSSNFIGQAPEINVVAMEVKR